MSRLVRLITLISLTGCTTTHLKRQDLERVRVGMDKGQVLDVVGNPKRTFHSEGRDHWTYQFFEYNQEMLQQVDFRDGHVTKVGQPTSRRGFANTLENADSMEDFERAVKEHQKKSNEFQDVPER